MYVYKCLDPDNMLRQDFKFISFEEFLKQQKQKEQKETHKFITFEEFLTQQEQTPSMREFLKKYPVKINH